MDVIDKIKKRVIDEILEDNKSKIASNIIYLKGLRIHKGSIKNFNESQLDIFAVWNDNDKFPSVKKFKTFQNDKFVDTDDIIWDNFGVIPKCFKCQRFWKKSCRGYYYNVPCVMNNYKNYIGKEYIKVEPPLMTYRQLSEWLAKGKGEVNLFGTVTTVFEYKDYMENERVSEKLKIREWNETSWKKPSIMYI